jgi:hypothetical protein
MLLREGGSLIQAGWQTGWAEQPQMGQILTPLGRSRNKAGGGVSITPQTIEIYVTSPQLILPAATPILRRNNANLALPRLDFR